MAADNPEIHAVAPQVEEKLGELFAYIRDNFTTDSPSVNDVLTELLKEMDQGLEFLQVRVASRKHF